MLSPVRLRLYLELCLLPVGRTAWRSGGFNLKGVMKCRLLSFYTVTEALLVSVGERHQIADNNENSGIFPRLSW
jgi:hypothetical protein